MELSREKTDSIIGTGTTEKIRRHKKALQSIISARDKQRERFTVGEALELESKIDAAGTEITSFEERVKLVADAENEERKTKETLLTHQRKTATGAEGRVR